MKLGLKKKKVKYIVATTGGEGRKAAVHLKKR